MANVNRILIVGGGIAGLSAANALHSQGFAPELIERSKQWPTTGTGIITHANGVRMLRALGLGADIDRIGAIIRRGCFYDQKGELLCESDLEELWQNVGPCLGISRIRLQNVLIRGASDVPLRLGVSLTALRQNGDRVHAIFSDGTFGDYDLVVGADGIHSTVRKISIGSSLSPSYAGSMGWRSLIPTVTPGVDDAVIFVLGEGCLFGLAPMGEGHTYGVGGIGKERSEDPVVGRLERFRHRFAEFGGLVPAYLEALKSDEQLHVSQIELIDLEEWYRGRVVLIGDAAHASVPNMAGGGCMAMEDAFVLADVLRAEVSVASALEAFVKRRKPRTQWVQKESRVAAQDSRLPSAVRNAALRELGDKMFRGRYLSLIPPP